MKNFKYLIIVLTVVIASCSPDESVPLEFEEANLEIMVSNKSLVAPDDYIIPLPSANLFYRDQRVIYNSSFSAEEVAQLRRDYIYVFNNNGTDRDHTFHPDDAYVRSGRQGNSYYDIWRVDPGLNGPDTLEDITINHPPGNCPIPHECQSE